MVQTWITLVFSETNNVIKQNLKFSYSQIWKLYKKVKWLWSHREFTTFLPLLNMKICNRKLLMWNHLYYFLLCVWVFCLHAGLGTMCVLGAQRSEHLISWVWNCKAAMWCWESNQGLLEEQPVLFPTELPLQPLNVFYKVL